MQVTERRFRSEMKQISGRVTYPGRKHSTMKKRNELQPGSPSEIGPGLEDLIRRDTRQITQQAIDAELSDLLARYENVKTSTRVDFGSGERKINHVACIL